MKYYIYSYVTNVQIVEQRPKLRLGVAKHIFDISNWKLIQILL